MPLLELGRFNRMEAHILIGRLESEGIPAIAFDGETSVGDGSYLFVPTRVMVDEEDAAAARAILRASEAGDLPE
jgi:hypothetical protein